MFKSTFHYTKFFSFSNFSPNRKEVRRQEKDFPRTDGLSKETCVFSGEVKPLVCGLFQSNFKKRFVF